MNKEDPFVIIRDHRTKQANQRVGLRPLDPNTLGNRVPVLTKRIYSFEDKENYNFLDEDSSKQLMRKIPTPNQSELINYSQYDHQF